MKKQKIIYILAAAIIGIAIGKYIYSSYKEETLQTFKSNDEDIYLLQYGVYKNENVMVENTKKLKNYFYYKEENGYHVIIGIIKNKNLKQKIVDSYKITENIYMKGVKTNNSEFLNLLDQYDNLISNTDDKDTIISAEKQVLSKYEELILQSE